MRKRKWRPPNNPTGPAKQVYRAIYGEPLPRGWHVQWAGFMRGALGLTIYREKRILLSFADARSRVVHRHRERGYGSIGQDIYTELGELHVTTPNHPPPTIVHGECVKTLIHEFVHLRNGPALRHGKEFDRLVEWGWKQLTERQP